MIENGLKPVDNAVHRGRKAPFYQKKVSRFQVMEQRLDRLLVGIDTFGRFQAGRPGGFRDQSGFIPNCH